MNISYELPSGAASVKCTHQFEQGEREFTVPVEMKRLEEALEEALLELAKRSPAICD